MIPRIRTVKPELFRHETLFEAEQVSGLPLRLAFVALLTCCDREGRFQWQARRLKLDILPYDEVDVAEVLQALHGYGFIQQYEHEGELYGCIPSWSKHQYCNQRESESVLPALEDATLISPQRYRKPTDTVGTARPVCEACDRDSEVASDTAHACTCMHVLKGREGKGRELEGEGKGTTVASPQPSNAMQSKIQSVFACWKQTMSHPQAILDPKRYALIRKALGLGYSVEQLCEAIRGCSLTPHNQGDNDRGQRYDGLHIILRDAEQIDRFLHNAQTPPRILSAADRLSRNNAQVLQRWADQNLLQEAVYEAH